MSPATIAMPRRKGRPKAGSTRAERLKHIKCTYLLLCGRYPAASLAAMHGVTERTIFRWRAWVLEKYDEPEALALQRFAERDQ
jgi:hypothetical protein